MPRYRFSWDNLPLELLHELGLGLKLQPPVQERLRTKYGARPKPDFVRDAWPTLLDAWLANDSISRELVVRSLRARGLGSTGVPTQSAADQMAYLRSCRNSTSLREVVLPIFTAFGESNPVRTPVPAPTSPQARDVDAPGAGEVAKPVSVDDQPVRSLNDWLVLAVAAIECGGEVARDSDGDIPLRYGSAMCYVRAVEEPPSILVFSPMVVEIPRTCALLEAINDINMNISVGRVFHTPGDAVMFALELYGEQLTIEILRASLDAATSIADHFDHDLQARFGGKIRFAEMSDDSVMV